MHPRTHSILSVQVRAHDRWNHPISDIRIIAFISIKEGTCSRCRVRLRRTIAEGVAAAAKAVELGIRSVVCKERSEEHTYELQPLMRIPYAVFSIKKKRK